MKKVLLFVAVMAILLEGCATCTTCNNDKIKENANKAFQSMDRETNK